MAEVPPSLPPPDHDVKNDDAAADSGHDPIASTEQKRAAAFARWKELEGRLLSNAANDLKEAALLESAHGFTPSIASRVGLQRRQWQRNLMRALCVCSCWALSGRPSSGG